MDMKWRSFSAGGEGAGQMQFFYTSAVALTVENEALKRSSLKKGETYSSKSELS